MPKAPIHKWTFRARFRRHAFGWRSQPAIKRIKEAVSEIKQVARKQPLLGAEGAVLADLVAHTPGEEGKWFAAAKSAKLFDEAIALANLTPCSPQTLTRAARDFAEKNSTFAIEAGLAALRWLVEGYGYEITGADVRAAYSQTMKAAENAGAAGEIRARIRELVSRETYGERFVTRILGHDLELR
jgi:hypothetical protein